MAYTTIDDPSAYFQTALYTGDDGTSRAVTNDGNSNLQPDWLWIKDRGDTSAPIMFDSTRGVNKKLRTDTAAAEETFAYLASFNSDGFTIATGDGAINEDASPYVAWQWVANGGTTTTNDASSTSVGTIDSVYQADTTAGFSIVTFTGTGSAGTIAHGLGSTPQVIITKDRGVVENFVMHHHTLGATFIMRMDDKVAKVDAASYNDTLPASTVFSVSDGGSNNQSGNTYVSYCFAEKQGYSKFGSYTGNGNANGPFIYTGFSPSWVMIKNATASFGSDNSWIITDSTRNPSNKVDNFLYANTSRAEGDADFVDMDFLSNGFKLRANEYANNYSGDTMIYMAFAESPFVSSKGVPTTAV